MQNRQPESILDNGNINLSWTARKGRLFRSAWIGRNSEGKK